MKKLFDGDVYADYGQFYVYDVEASPDDLPELTPASAKELCRRGYRQTDSVACFVTRAHFHVHWLEVYLADSVPRFKEAHQSKLTLPFTLEGDGIIIHGPTTSESQYGRCNIPAGTYQLYVFGYNLGIEAPPPPSSGKRGKVSHDGEGYRLVFVPD